jgi:glycosyltransferase involved in cell wall biosynthesis
LQALELLDEEVHLVFIGGKIGSSDLESNTAFASRLEALIGDLDLGRRVHWTGFVSEEDVSGYLHACDLMVMPYKDGASLRRGTLMTVLAHGRPLITTVPAKPTHELIHGRTACFVPINDPTSLADTIRAVASDQELRHQLEAGSIELAATFSWDKIADRTASFFAELVTERGS